MLRVTKTGLPFWVAAGLSVQLDEMLELKNENMPYFSNINGEVYIREDQTKNGMIYMNNVQEGRLIRAANTDADISVD